MASSPDRDTDVAIIGGGPVGAALALALEREHRGAERLRTTLLEARTVPADDPRPIALSHGSRLLLERLCAWEALQPTPILHVHVSQQGGFGRVALSAHEVGVPALGHVVDYHAVSSALMRTLAGRNVELRLGARATALSDIDGGVRIDYAQDGAAGSLDARLAVVADGGELEGLSPPRVTDYGQCALTACVASEFAHGNVAYERFTRDGAIALLPFGAELALVWTQKSESAAALQAVDNTGFLAALREAFGGRLGAFTRVTGRAMYALALRRGAQSRDARRIAIGNAAQTLHPVAGQGFNLGLRDAWELAQALSGAAPSALGDARLLAHYRAARRIDRETTVGVTHGLVRLFANDYIGLPTLRGAGMTLVGSVPPLRDFFARRMVFGVRG